MRCLGCLWGEKPDCVLACCNINQRVIGCVVVSEDDGYLHEGIIQWSPGSIRGVRVLLLCSAFPLFVIELVSVFLRSSGGLCVGGVLPCAIRWYYVCVLLGINILH